MAWGGRRRVKYDTTGNERDDCAHTHQSFGPYNLHDSSIPVLREGYAPLTYAASPNFNCNLRNFSVTNTPCGGPVPAGAHLVSRCSQVAIETPPTRQL